MMSGDMRWMGGGGGGLVCSHVVFPRLLYADEGTSKRIEVSQQLCRLQIISIYKKAAISSKECVDVLSGHSGICSYIYTTSV